MDGNGIDIYFRENIVKLVVRFNGVFSSSITKKSYGFAI